MLPWETAFDLPDFLLSTTIKGSLILAAGWAAAAFLARASASLRHLVWCLSFSGILVVMVGFLVLPRWHLGFLPSPNPPVEKGWVSEAPAQAADEAGPEDIAGKEDGEIPSLEARQFSPPLLSDSWKGFLLTVWALGFGFIYLRFFAGLIKVWRLTRTAQRPKGGRWDNLVEALRLRFGLRRPVQVAISQKNITPMTWGLRRALILLPRDAIHWDEQRLRMVMIHEAAHVKRKDYLVLLITQFLCACYWFNPLIWLGLRHLVREREHACDDQVLSLGEKASDYADHLLDIARGLGGARCPAFASLSMAKPSELEGRLVSLLDTKVDHAAPTKATFLKAVALGLLPCLPLAALTPWPASTASQWQRFEGGELAGLDFSRSQRSKLAAFGVTPTYIRQLLAAGYENPTTDQIISLKKMGVNPRDIETAKFAKPLPVERVEDRTLVCMLADSLLEKPALALKIHGKIYFGTPSCTVTLAKYPTLRQAHDPLTGQMVDKADAVVGAYPNGKLLYFASESNLECFNRGQSELSYNRANPQFSKHEL